MTAGTEPHAPWRAAVACVVVLCAACGGSPTASRPTCSDQRAVTINTPVEGALLKGDARFAGAYIDYYAVQLDTASQLTIRMTATRFAPVILIFGNSGDVVAQAFLSSDPGPDQPESPTLTRALPSGCTLIGATSYDPAPDATGAYTLVVGP